ncbi:Carcinoembryonic antigen-related cell adhesion molecule 1 [Pichia kudriavzevii]|uniref:Carcinoembryonic antigen-related cell adhesion molecule 1 n=1 Tax=Pichia kudriavzevii TaxID=4909 RepID=A0A1V2LH26_PICKU|nr:Carcinoembryonic antigen-related cell adhesion molecule 1 [Pichia kudriavzevii]
MTTNTLISNTFATSGTYSVLDNGSSTLTDALALITAIPNSTGDSSSATSGIPNDETVTVYTYNSQNSLKPSIELIVPTITTNTLPTGLLPASLGFDSSIFKKKIGAGAVAGIAIGAILGLLLLLGLFIFYFLRKRKNGGSVIDWLHGLKRSDDHYSRKSVYIGDASHYKENGSEDSLVQTDSRYYNSERYPEPQIPDDPTSNSTIKKTPPLVNRDKKPSLFLTPSPIKPALTVDHSPVQEDEFDMSLFDMRSELNKINDSTDTVHYLFPPAPAPRKTVKGINSIDKMNYQVDDTPTTPIDRLPIDRTMSVLYESPNEQCIWDEFESAKDSGLMNHSGSMTNAKNYSADTEFDTSKHGKSSKCDQIFEQLRADGDYDDTLRDSILSSDRRVRSGSGAKRYEYIVNNVSTFKNELEKERLGSPLKSTFGFESMDDTVHLSETPNGFPNSETVKEFIDYVKKVPPPIPKPRKNI